MDTWIHISTPSQIKDSNKSKFYISLFQRMSQPETHSSSKLESYEESENLYMKKQRKSLCLHLAFWDGYLEGQDTAQ